MHAYLVNPQNSMIRHQPIASSFMYNYTMYCYTWYSHIEHCMVWRQSRVNISYFYIVWYDEAIFVNRSSHQHARAHRAAKWRTRFLVLSLSYAATRNR